MAKKWEKIVWIIIIRYCWEGTSWENLKHCQTRDLGNNLVVLAIILCSAKKLFLSGMKSRAGRTGEALAKIKLNLCIKNWAYHGWSGCNSLSLTHKKQTYRPLQKNLIAALRYTRFGGCTVFHNVRGLLRRETKFQQNSFAMR